MFQPTDLRPFLFVLPLFVVTPTATAQGTMADQFSQAQDFDAAPPTLGFYLDEIYDWALPSRSYEHLSGPPFPSPRPFYLPPDLQQLIIECDTGSNVDGGDPPCLSLWREFFVTMVFTDGSRYSFEDLQVSVVCGSSSSFFHKRYQVSELGPPGDRDDLIHVESWTQEDLSTTRENRVRGKSGTTASYTGQAGNPVVSGGPLSITLAPGGVLDLQQNSAASGPLFVTDQPALLYCDTVLMDPGVLLSDLFSPPPVILPGATEFDVEFAMPAFRATRLPAVWNNPALLHNTGNVAQDLVVTWSGPATTPGQLIVHLPAGATQLLSVPSQLPPGSVLGDISTVDVQVSSVQDPNVQRSRTLHLLHDHPGVLRFGQGTPGCLGPHGVDVSGPAVTGGPNVAFTCSQNAPATIGAALFGGAAQPGTVEIFPDGQSLDIALFDWIFSIPIQAGPTGVASVSTPIPDDPNLRGAQLIYQPVMLWLNPCSPHTATISSGQPLRIEVR